MADHLVLVGMMGSGKTTVGRRVAQRLGRLFLDSDAQVEIRTGRTVAEIWRADGEPAFRELETEALADALSRDEPSVIAAAGGVVVSEENRRLLREHAGTVVWLRARPEFHARRARHGTHRPLLDEDPVGTMRRLEEARRPLYEEVADTVVDVEHLSPGGVVDRVLGAVETHR
jgi:shikimate kinase